MAVPDWFGADCGATANKNPAIDFVLKWLYKLVLDLQHAKHCIRVVIFQFQLRDHRNSMSAAIWSLATTFSFKKKIHNRYIRDLFFLLFSLLGTPKSRE